MAFMAGFGVAMHGRFWVATEVGIDAEILVEAYRRVYVLGFYDAVVQQRGDSEVRRYCPIDVDDGMSVTEPNIEAQNSDG